LTRIGLFAALIATIPLALLWRQNHLIEKQNQKIDSQNLLFSQQNERIDRQIIIDSLQRLLFVNQNEKMDTQNLLFKDQNEKVTLQTDFLRAQTGLLRNQNRLLTGQTTKIDTQNYRINLQNNLIEAERRGALVFLMSNILDQMYTEIERQKKDTLIKNPTLNQDSLVFSLSDPLLGRIAALSQGFLPYRFLEGDTLTEKPVSLERGQLLMVLVKSKLDIMTYRKLYESTNFSSALLIHADLRYADLRGINLQGSDLSGANLQNAQISGANLRGSNLSDVNLKLANLAGTDLEKANLREVDLYKASLNRANLSEANLTGADLNYADLSLVNLYEAKLKDAFFGKTILKKADFYGVKNLTFEQLNSMSSLYKCKNLDPNIRKQLESQSPCLFEEPTLDDNYEFNYSCNQKKGN